jgi:hypothetical protein
MGAFSNSLLNSRRILPSGYHARPPRVIRLRRTGSSHATARELVKPAIDTTCPDRRGRVDEF